jgi:hypothetical protein
MQVRLESGPGRLTGREQLRDRDLQSIREEVQRRERRLGEAVLERADVGLGVATFRQLRLGHVRPQAFSADDAADPAGERTIRDGVGASHSWHARQCTLRSNRG